MTDTIPFSDWEKLDLRIGKILKAEDIEGADKLYKLSVDLGKEAGKRIVCAGLKNHYSKDELKGKKIVLFTNLAPRKLKGITSECMVLAAVNENGEEEKVILLAPEKDIEAGAKIR